ncbi:hypothetical protein [Brevundimonas sp. R86498]|uniref:hypothetical protein n=1 Tax=Brevundimonas sp. R86498 TaxID=3093845 RepID=UPI0037CCA211
MTEALDCTAASAFQGKPDLYDPCDVYAGSNDYGDADDETRMVMALLSLIAGGFSEGRQLLAEAAAAESGVSSRYALGVLDRFTGRTFGDHYWTFHRAGRGQRLYTLLSPGS